MDGPGDYHIKWSKTGRESQILYNIAYMQNLKNDKNKSILQNRNRFKDLENELWLPGDKILGGEG